ncbi:MAG TPA: alpha/beta fold hydrolase [Arthrobacter sp.]|nr:alpha/beta fold hydrolase [Arthrobacter sp.]
MTTLEPPRPFASNGHGPNSRIGVVLSHGFTGSPRSLQNWAEYLAEVGFAVRLPLLPGHGTTWQDLAKTPWQRWYGAVEQAYDELARERSTVFAAGLSMGGALALRLAAYRPVAGVVAVNPGLTFANPAARFAGVLKYIVKSTPAIANDISKPGQDEQAYARTPVAAVHQLSRLFADTTASLPRVAAPALIFRSMVDHVVPESSTALIRAQIGSRHLTVVELGNSYHVATMDNDAEQIFDHSARFILENAGERNATNV